DQVGKRHGEAELGSPCESLAKIESIKHLFLNLHHERILVANLFKETDKTRISTGISPFKERNIRRQSRPIGTFFFYIAFQDFDQVPTVCSKSDRERALFATTVAIGVNIDCRR